MRKELIILIIGLICSSCMAQKTIKLINYEHKTGTEKKIKYLMDVPKEGYKDKLIVSGSHETEHRVVYQDSSIIYLTNDEAGSALNYDNIQKISDKQQTGKLFVDTLSLEGQTKEGLYWKEVKLDEISIGYVNVPPDKKERYEQALSTIRRKE